MSSLAGELESCFQNVVAALQSCSASAAADSYFLARSRIRLLLEVYLGGSSSESCAEASVVAAACRQAAMPAGAPTKRVPPVTLPSVPFITLQAG